jgi:hypothetical protein
MAQDRFSLEAKNLAVRKWRHLSPTWQELDVDGPWTLREKGIPRGPVSDVW